MIDVHFWPTPNGKKVTILLEELRPALQHHALQHRRGRPVHGRVPALNPNHRMPVIVDHEPAGGGAPISVFESGRDHDLHRREGRQVPARTTSRGRYEVIQWVMWQMANQGPEARRVRPFPPPRRHQGDQSYAVRRFTDEVNRLYGVLNNRLYDRR